MDSGNVKTETAVRELFVPYSEEAKAALAGRLGDAWQRRGKFVGVLAEITKNLKAKIKEAQEDMDALVAQQGAKGDVAPVEVECRWDYGTNTYTEKRKDSGEIIKQRAITAEERQEGLGLKPAERAVA